MTCQCVCGCKEIRNVSGDPLEMCAACQLCYDLDSSVHHLPYTRPGLMTWVPYEPISDAEKDAAIAKMIAESGL